MPITQLVALLQLAGLQQTHGFWSAAGSTKETSSRPAVLRLVSPAGNSLSAFYNVAALARQRLAMAVDFSEDFVLFHSRLSHIWAHLVSARFCKTMTIQWHELD